MVKKVIVAIDHQASSLAKYTGLTLSNDNVAELRSNLAQVFSTTAADGLVISHDAIDSISLLGSKQEPILGLPDFTSEYVNELTGLGLLLGSSSEEYTTAKFGYNVYSLQKNASMNSAVRNFIMKCSPKHKIIMEPYFIGINYRNTDIAQYIQSMNLQQVHSWKLPLDTFLEQKNTIQVPTYIRSDGLEFDQFITKLEKADLCGITGFIVGAAIWKDKINEVRLSNNSTNELVDIFNHRISILKNI